MDRKKIQAVLFFLAGAVLFWFVYKDLDVKKVGSQLHRIGWWWVAVSLACNLISQLLRAIRWKQLITPMGFQPRTGNLFLAYLVLALVNLIIPRGGEVARLGVIRKFETIPFTKLLGTALAERLTDLLLLVLIAAALITWQFQSVEKLVDLTGLGEVTWKTIHGVLWVAGGLGFLVLVYLIITRTKYRAKLKNWFKKVKQEVREGFHSISRMKNKFLYGILSVLIYGFWLMMFYVLFFAYPPTGQLSFKTAAFTFGLSTLAFLIPVQAGIGAWHFMVIQCLLIFGIDESTGKIFALLSHTCTMLINLVFGSVALIVLPLINRSPKTPKPLDGIHP